MTGRLLEHADAAGDQIGAAAAEASSAEPVARERLQHGPHPRSVEDQPRPEVPVLRIPDRFVEPADRRESLAAHRRQPEDEVPAQDRRALVVDLERELGRIRASHRHAVDLEDGVAREHVEIGSRPREVGQRLEAFGHVHVVSVQNDHEVAGRNTGGRVPGRRRAAVLLPDERDPLRVRRDRAHEVVRGPVVADDHLERELRLSEHRFDRLGDETGDVVRGDDHAEGRLRPRLQALRCARGECRRHAASRC